MQAPERSIGSGKTARSYGAAVLVVDDQRLSGHGLVAVLETAGMQTIGPVESADAAIVCLDRHACGLVIVDAGQLGRGEEVPLLDRLRRAGTPVIVTSTPSFTPDGVSALPGVPHLAKPVSAHAIVAAARAALQ